jgi:large subunit ribosomal protein L35
MPKLKTHKGARKRFKVSRKGKVLHSKMNRRHLLECKNSNRRRRLRKGGKLADTQAVHVRRLLPYGD